MDELTHARDVLQQILQEHKTLEAGSPSLIQSHYIEDVPNDEYLIIHTGYSQEDGHRIHGVIFHVWFRDGKIWIERDNVFPSVVSEMIERGVPAPLFAREPYRLPLPVPA